MSSYVDILKTNNFQSLLKNEDYSKQIKPNNQPNKAPDLNLNNGSKLEEKNKEIWTTEYILGIYKNISEI